MRRGFTLLELIIVIIVIGILATLGFTQYSRVVEKGRVAEAKAVLGQIRTAQESYKLEYGSYTATIGNLSTSAPTACTSTHYFSYSTSSTLGIATRCTTSGKTPNGTAYSVTVDYGLGTWSGTTGYY